MQGKPYNILLIHLGGFRMQTEEVKQQDDIQKIASWLPKNPEDKAQFKERMYQSCILGLILLLTFSAYMVHTSEVRALEVANVVVRQCNEHIAQANQVLGQGVVDYYGLNDSFTIALEALYETNQS